MEVIGFVNWQDLSFLANILTVEQQPFTLNYRGNLFPIIVPQQIFWNNFYGFDVGGQSPLLFCLFIISVFIDKFYEYSQDSKFCIGNLKGFWRFPRNVFCTLPVMIMVWFRDQPGTILIMNC